MITFLFFRMRIHLSQVVCSMRARASLFSSSCDHLPLFVGEISYFGVPIGLLCFGAPITLDLSSWYSSSPSVWRFRLSCLFLSLSIASSSSLLSSSFCSSSELYSLPLTSTIGGFTVSFGFRLKTNLLKLSWRLVSTLFAFASLARWYSAVTTFYRYYNYYYYDYLVKCFNLFKFIIFTWWVWNIYCLFFVVTLSCLYTSI